MLPAKTRSVSFRRSRECSERSETSTDGSVAPDPAIANGYAIERSFYRLDGTKVDLRSLARNERVVVAPKVTEAQARYARLLIVDRLLSLPAGYLFLSPEEAELVRVRSSRPLAGIRSTSRTMS